MSKTLTMLSVLVILTIAALVIPSLLLIIDSMMANFRKAHLVVSVALRFVLD